MTPVTADLLQGAGRAAGVAVLTLTYGDRSALLDRMLAGVAAEGVTRVLVLANGLAPEPAARLAALAEAAPATHGVTLEIHASPVNLGSAAGYARLVAAALARPRPEADPDLGGLWFLDDDNSPRPGSLARLLSVSAARGGAAACAVRSDRRYLVEAAAGGAVSPPAAGEAFGTDLRRLATRAVRKAGRKLGLSPPHMPPSVPAPEAVAFPRVPYGGLFVPAALARRVDPPRGDFVIYADDYDYSERLAAAGGLYLVGGAVVDDLEASWNASGQGRDAAEAAVRRVSQSARLATMPADFRLYYAVRNALWLDRQRVRDQAGGALWFWINLAAFAGPVLLRAALKGRRDNVAGLQAAIRDALAGRMGADPRFPLPGNRG